MQNKPLLYSHYDVTFQEVPGEISLVIDITGCQHYCPDCHSKFLWDYHGNSVREDLPALLDKYDGLITCVCFMGGEQNPIELSDICHMCKIKHLKTCLYTGSTMGELCSMFPKRFIRQDYLYNRFLSRFDYIKTGPYRKELGGLDSKITNQRFYKIYPNLQVRTEDVTYLFQKEYK